MLLLLLLLGRRRRAVRTTIAAAAAVVLLLLLLLLRGRPLALLRLARMRCYCCCFCCCCWCRWCRCSYRWRCCRPILRPSSSGAGCARPKPSPPPKNVSPTVSNRPAPLLSQLHLRGQQAGGCGSAGALGPGCGSLHRVLSPRSPPHPPSHLLHILGALAAHVQPRRCLLQRLGQVQAQRWLDCNDGRPPSLCRGKVLRHLRAGQARQAGVVAG